MGFLSKSSPMATRTASMLETSCGYLLQELQMIWDEIGEDQFEREKVLVDLEQECLQVYRRKVDNVNKSRARLHQELADSEAQFTHLLLSLDERSLPTRREKMVGTLKEQLEAIAPALQKLQIKKAERMKQFETIKSEIQKISTEIAGQSEDEDLLPCVIVDENDISLKRLEAYQMELQRLHDDKNDRLERVKNYIITIQNLSATLGMDSSMIITKVHPSFNDLSGLPKNMSDGVLTKLNSTVEFLEAERHSRIKKLQKLGSSLKNLWDLLDTPYIDRQQFSHIFSSSTGVSTPGGLTITMIEQAEAEVERLDKVKVSKMKELLVKKQTELETICRRSHMEVPPTPLTEMDHILNLVKCGEMDYADILRSMDEQIAKAEGESLSRKMIIEKVEKWGLARDEERWLEEYNMDDNRYFVSRGAHRNLKRAERARVMVKRIPALVKSLIAKTNRWEEERKKLFIYDKVPLLALMEEYNLSRRDKEKEKQRHQMEKKSIQSKVPLLHERVTLARPTTSFRSRLDQIHDGEFKRGSTPLISNGRSPFQNVAPNGWGAQEAKKFPNSSSS
ncbi:hypothetical protein SSX86_007218 [Deinandra increscens subsp. villosa]|uniref:Uncharacterized protein n=1 Tax=Deinandra increscens subsp. villosa TaxID=3103831 RepID=A0AAP0DG96_9ASTR